jgi:two-component system alkaline phosphatase synthesis response regulator PhoP
MPRILIVEDEPDVAFGLTEDLTRHGYETEVARDGEAALQLGSTGKFDLILLDVMLPLADGFDVCRELRRRRVTVPIILLTAKAHETEKVLGLELGADDYVTKPFSPRELSRRVSAHLPPPKRRWSGSRIVCSISRAPSSAAAASPSNSRPLSTASYGHSC